MNCADALPFIFFLKSVVLLFFLCAACVSDLRTRSVPDSLWLAAFLTLFPMIVAEIFIIGFSRLFDISVSAVFVFLFSAACFSLHIFGGADCKVFLLISIAFPFGQSDLFSLSDLFSSVPFTVLFNSLLLSLIFLFSFFVIRFFKRIHSERLTDSSAGLVSAGQMLTFSFPFLPSITGGLILAFCGINLFWILFFFFFPAFLYIFE